MHIIGVIVRLIPVTAYISFDLYETYLRYVSDSFPNISYAAHIGGGFAG